ncbi:MAG: DUF3445 domain-containing protein [Cyanobacteria bacterium J06581_3]
MYLPFVKEKGRLRMGLQPLPVEDWIVIDQDFCEQLAEKKQLLKYRHGDVFAEQENTQPAQQEVLSLLVNHLLQCFPDVYQSANDGQEIHNLKTQQVWKYSDFEQSPLDLAGRLVTEDLCLMMPSPAGYCLAAASVCFPLRWVLKDKMGKPMGQIHTTVPDYTKKLARPVDSVFSRLKEDFPGLRLNWSIVDSPDLHLMQDKRKTTVNSNITAEDAGHCLWLRVERQTIRRLVTSGGILFTIRSFVYPLSQVVEIPGAAKQLFEAIQLLKKEMQTYKNILPFKPALLEYLSTAQLF